MLRDLARVHTGEKLPGIERLRHCLETGTYAELPSVLLDCLYAFPYNIMEDEYAYHAALHGIFLGMHATPRASGGNCQGDTIWQPSIAAGLCLRAEVQRNLGEAQAQADRRQYGRSLPVELEQSRKATCIALNITKTYDGEIGIEGSQRPVQDADGEWILLHSEGN